MPAVFIHFLKRDPHRFSPCNIAGRIACPAAQAGFLLTASHSDSPCFRLRDHAELTGEYIRLSAERYGGMINDSWLDRPLSVAGRVLVRREGGLEARLVDLKRDVALIPPVAIHLNRETHHGVTYDPARDLVALYAARTGSGDTTNIIAPIDTANAISFFFKFI